MHLPFAEEAVVGHDKLANYLLSREHPHGKSKSIFFTRIGLRRDEPEVLRDALIRLARITDMEEIAFQYGVKYIGTGNIVTPTGRTAAVTTVWILRDGKPPPSLVTACPG